MKLIFAGTPEFSVPTLRALLNSEHQVAAVYTQPDRPAGRGRKLQPGPVKALAQANQIAVEQPLNFKSATALDALKAYQADLMIVVAYGLILPDSVLQTPRFGCVNIHASLLPRWRGAAPIQRAIEAGDPETGICLMQMDSGLDTGEVLDLRRCPIESYETGQTLHDKLADMGAQALLELLPRISSQQLQPQPQDPTHVTYAHKLDKSEGNIDWRQDAHHIDRKIRAFNPWPGAYTQHQGQALKIWAARPEASEGQSTAGTVKVDGRRLWVMAGHQTQLEITQLQPAGKRRMSAQAYLAAHDPDGSKLG